MAGTLWHRIFLVFFISLDGGESESRDGEKVKIARCEKNRSPRFINFLQILRFCLFSPVDYENN